jgi:CDP-glycerol glycerophosphotransferase (TagB/SpsB family)
MGEARLRSTVGWIMLNLPPAGNYRHIFTRYRPDLVVVTRVLGSSPDYLVLKQAARRKVPVVALVSSWDNFTSKGFFPFGVQWLVVWNDIMRQEAIELFGFPPDRIFVSGIPRFDHYFRREGMRTRAQFFADLGLDPEKRLITFATGNKNLLVGPQDPTSPEPEIAEFLADAIDQGVLGYPAQLLVRLHPLADLTAYSKLWHRQGVTLQVPGNRSAFRDRLFSKVDEVELGETMWHSDVVVNIASTITIDAAVFDTPVVCIGFDMRGERPYLESVRRFYDYEHYRKLTKTGGFRIAWSKSELLDQIRLYLKDPSRDRDNRLKIVQQQCQYVDGRAGERVAMYLLEILSCMGAL